LENLLNVCNMHGIKARRYWPHWKNRTTYFLMPDWPSRVNLIKDDIIKGSVKIDGDDFVRFWYELGDLHKERRLLADFMATFRHFQDSLEPAIPRQQGQKNILIDLMTDIAMMARTLFIRDQKKPEFLNTVTRFFSAYPFRRMESFSAAMSFFQFAFLRTVRIGDVSSRRNLQRLLLMKPCVFINFILNGFIRTYLGWVALDTSNLQRYLKDHTTLEISPDCQLSQNAYLKKLKVAPPHWRPEDRDFMLRAIKTKGKSCRDSFVERVLNEVGVDQFKVLVFGKEKFCGNCGRSSYVGSERLWCCRRCVEEHIRPKARYCNVECQKAHWHQHRYESHGGKKPVEKKAQASASAKQEPTRKKKHSKKCLLGSATPSTRLPRFRGCESIYPCGCKRTTQFHQVQVSLLVQQPKNQCPHPIFSQYFHVQTMKK